ncbi:MAG: Ig-like domain-containing protein, partial [Methanothrix sp.]
ATGCVYTPIICDDENACTDDSCDPATGCVYTPIICDDENACTDDSCDPATGCVYTPIICDDENACTDDSCDPATGCVYTPIICDDENACTIDSCDPLTGCTYEDVDCDDDDACTIDSCDPLTGCTYEDVDCDDDDACTIDSCDPLTGCTYEDVDCDDGDACTIDSCDPLTGCTYEDVDCDDGDACTIDSCDPLTGCTYEDVDCDDGDPCTEDSCDPAIGCIHIPIIPEAVDDSYGAIYGKTLTVSAGEGVLVNDVYDGSGTMTATLVTGPSSGTLSLNADGSFTYKPKTGFVGTVTFTYEACDGNCCSDPATVTIIVAKCPWTLRNDMYSAKCGEDKVVPASQGILANDPTAIAVIDPESITIDPVYGTIEVNEDGSFVYHAAEVISSGTYVQFTYTATNGVCPASNLATAKIQIICPCR